MRPLLLLGLLACDSAIQSGTVKPGEGDPCDGACQDTLTCTQAGVCAADGVPGTALSGDDCSATADCAWSLECNSANQCADADAAQTGGAGDACGGDEDCQAGYSCDGDVCIDLEIPYWEGGACPADAGADEEFKVLYQIPDLPTTDELDFFSMPFPNNLRLDSAGRPQMDGFPVPGDESPTAGRLLALIEQQSYWGLDPVVLFRFNKAQDLDTIRVGTTDATLHFASIDADAEDFGGVDDFEYFTRQSRDRYVCRNWLAITTFPGRQLLPNHNYAVWITKGVESGGAEVFRDDDFKVLMQDERPDDVTDARAYDAFAPFRDYVDENGLSRGEVVAATVFSTGDPARDLRYTREVVESDETIVSVNALDLCGASPCERACVGASGLAEKHGNVSIPDFSASGSVQYNGTFRPVVQETDSVCAVLTVPQGAAPDAGWPVALWLGDLGGDAQDAVRNGVAEAFAQEGVATLSIDLPHHADRAEAENPLAAWFAVERPDRWRATLFQAFADGLVLQRLAADPLLGLDPDQVWMVGEGVGADAGVPILAWGKELRGGVLGNPSGMVGELATLRSAPYDVEHALQRAVADTNVSRFHPLVGLLQQWMGPIDPMASAQGVLRDASTLAKHVLVVSGVDDGEVPDAQREAVLRAMSVPTVGTMHEDYNQADGDSPLKENVSTPDGKRTAGELQFQAGHRALSETASEQAAAFVGSGVRDGAPTITE
ncbi:MAG: hypothetical protein EXR71_13710 [Myxococcales bacterium]|nr:hypothetical protein [Myxococcales bacterium]